MAQIKILEKDIQSAICEYLFDMKKYYGWRQNNTPVVQKEAGGGFRFRRMPKYAKKGVPDIFLMLRNGRMIFIEVKTASGSLSEHQIEFQKECKRLGFEYLVARSLDDVLEYGL